MALPAALRVLGGGGGPPGEDHGPGAEAHFWIHSPAIGEGRSSRTRVKYTRDGDPEHFSEGAPLSRDPAGGWYRFVLDSRPTESRFIERYPEEARTGLGSSSRRGRVELVSGHGRDARPSTSQAARRSCDRSCYGKGRTTASSSSRRHRRLADRHVRSQRADAADPDLAGYHVRFWSQRGGGRPRPPVGVPLGRDSDGSRHRTFLLPHALCAFHGAPRAPGPFAAFARPAWDGLPARDRPDGGPLRRGRSEPERRAGADGGTVQPSSRARDNAGLACEAFERLRRRIRTLHREGGANPIFSAGNYSSGIELKQWMRAPRAEADAGGKARRFYGSLVVTPATGERRPRMGAALHSTPPTTWRPA
jgi:hypothetical protein